MRSLAPISDFCAQPHWSSSSSPSRLAVATATGVGNLGPNGGAPGSQQEFLVTVGDRVFFDTDSSNLTATATATLDKQAAWLNHYSNYQHILIEGHADERGTREYNIALGARRAIGGGQLPRQQGRERRPHHHEIVRQGTPGGDLRRHFVLVAKPPRRDGRAVRCDGRFAAITEA